MRRYLGQLATFLAPRSVEVADLVLRQFACWLLAATSVTAVAAISRDDIEDFKVWLAARPGGAAGRLSASTYRQRLRTLRMFFERIIEWDWPDAPPRNPVIGGDIPPRPDSLPKFLNDQDAATLMAAARAAADRSHRARAAPSTGIRSYSCVAGAQRAFPGHAGYFRAAWSLRASKPRCSRPNDQTRARTSQLCPLSAKAITPMTRTATPTPADTRAVWRSSRRCLARVVAASWRPETYQAHSADAASHGTGAGPLHSRRSHGYHPYGW